tara:strand:- start:927 stop:1277 length:351 start_codon:yes stop_codon:yes gene_type:complete
MEKYSKIILAVIMLGIVIWVWSSNWSKPETVVTTNQKSVDSLKTIITSYEQKQKVYDSTITNLSIEIVNLKKQIAQDDKSLIELKKKINEKTNNISKFTVLDISNFVSDRYRDSIR